MLHLYIPESTPIVAFTVWLSSFVVSVLKAAVFPSFFQDDHSQIEFSTMSPSLMTQLPSGPNMKGSEGHTLAG